MAAVLDPIFSPPIAPERDPPIQAYNYKPSWFPINSIVFGQSTIVTLGNNPYGQSVNYSIGSEVRFNIPFYCGARQLNQATGFVVALNGNVVTVTTNSSVGVDPFVVNPTGTTTPATMTPVGDINTGNQNQTAYYVNPYMQGAFQNISHVYQR